MREIGRRLIPGVGWRTTVAEEGSPSGGDVPFVGVNPPASPSDGELWWDPDDDTPVNGGSQPFEYREYATTYAEILAAWDETPGGPASYPLFELAEGETLFFIVGRCTEAYDDTFEPEITVAPTGHLAESEEGPSMGPDVNTPLNGLVGVNYTQATDVSWTQMRPAMLETEDADPVEYSVFASGLNGDGATGACTIKVLIGTSSAP